MIDDEIFLAGGHKGGCLALQMSNYLIRRVSGHILGFRADFAINFLVNILFGSCNFKRSKEISSPSSHHCNELGELELELDRDDLGDVGHGPDQLVVVAQQVVIQPLGVRVPAATKQINTYQDQEEDSDNML